MTAEVINGRTCEACGTHGAGRIKVRTTNGALRLCQQCLNDINRKNPTMDAAIRAAEAAQRDKDATICDRIYREYGEAVRTTATPDEHEMNKNRAYAAGYCAGEIRNQTEAKCVTVS